MNLAGMLLIGFFKKNEDGNWDEFIRFRGSASLIRTIIVLGISHLNRLKV